MKALVLFDTMGGNTEKIATQIFQTIQSNKINCDLIKLDENTKLELYDYDLIFLGSPVIEWLPTSKMMKFVKAKMLEHRLRGDIIPSSPQKQNKYAVCFGTYCGAHIGEDEALPMTQWLAAFFGHIGFNVLEQINIPSEMRNFGQGKGWMNDNLLEKLNTMGKCKNIIGRPNKEDLIYIEQKLNNLISSLKH